MDSDEMVRKVWERDRLAHEAAEKDAFNELHSSRYAAYAVLGDIRRNIRALRSANEMTLEPLTIWPIGGRNETRTAGWLLYTQSKGEGEYSHYYLLIDGKLAENRLFVGDKEFWDWVTSGLPSMSKVPSEQLRAGIAALYRKAELPLPEFPALESYSQAGGLSYNDRDRLYRKISAEPLPKPPPSREKRSWLKFGR